MRTAKPTGTPFTAASRDLVNDWSRQIFAALSVWADTHDGRWTQWGGGYLLLEIGGAGGGQVEPILIDTANEEIRVEFGYWETEFPEEASDAEGAAREVIALVSDWLSGEIRTAVFTDHAGHWCGTKVIKRDATMPPSPGEGIASFNPTRVEVRGPYRRDWMIYAV